MCSIRLKVVGAGTDMFANSVCNPFVTVPKRHDPKSRVTRLVTILFNQPENHARPFDYVRCDFQISGGFVDGTSIWHGGSESVPKSLSRGAKSTA